MRRSSAMMSRIKSDGLSASVVMVETVKLQSKAWLHNFGNCTFDESACHPERSAAEAKDPAKLLNVMQRGSSTALGMTATNQDERAANYRPIHTRRSRALE